MQKMWILLLSCVALATVIHGFPGGAPITTCGSLRPLHADPMQEGPAPYEIAFDGEMYGPRAMLTVSITTDDYFRGVHCQVRDQDGDPVGRFVRFDEDNFKTLNCNFEDDTALTHSNNDVKNDGARFQWEAPDMMDGAGMLIANCTVVKEYETYWVGIESTPIAFDEEATPPPPSSDESEEDDDDDMTGIIVGVAIGVTVLLSLLAAAFAFFRWR